MPSNRKTPKLILVNFKIPRDELEELLKNCKKNTRGNLSAWIREAGRKYRPAKGKFAR